MKTDREKILDDAKKCVCEDRDNMYGQPEDCFGTIAELWSVYLDRGVTRQDVCNMMILLKMVRLKATDGEHRDSWVDIAGYAACGGSMMNFGYKDEDLSF